jgi:hypothetical protein
MEKLIEELSKKSYLTDEEYEKYKDVLKEACNPRKDGNIEKIGNPFTKTGTYCGKKVQKLVCLTRTLLGDEIWKKHPNSEYGIEVSNYGRVRKIKPELDPEWGFKEEGINIREFWQVEHNFQAF